MTAFEMDITQYLQEENQIVICVADPSDTLPISRGKQKIKHGGIWYTPTSGIWQSVWIEYLPPKYIKSLRITPDLDLQKVEISIVTNDGEGGFAVVLDGKEYRTEGDKIEIDIQSPVYWTPENPYLYYFTVRYCDDEAQSYFAMRKFSLGRRDDGKPVLYAQQSTIFYERTSRPRLLVGRSLYRAERRGNDIRHTTCQELRFQHVAKAHQSRAYEVVLSLRQTWYDSMAGLRQRRRQI